jgi:hypothetical protein
MAALARTDVHRPLPVGDRMQRTFRVTVSNLAAADEWVPTGLSFIDAIIGWAAIGQAGIPDAPVFRKNAQGTGVAEGTNGGDLAIEVVTTAGTFEVTVLGKP